MSLPLPVSTPDPSKTQGHPTVAVMHWAFKLAALLTYVFGPFVFGGFSGDYVFSFILTTILVSLDFWVVKNVTGRLLVGMRWHNETTEDGTSTWVFESSVNESQINSADKTLFWVALVGWPVVWSALFLLELIRFELEWVLLIVIALSLGTSNLVGFWKCSKGERSDACHTDSARRVQTFAAHPLISLALSRVQSFFP
ncbi:MAG: uncharacterized protein KVP18_000162 [Porospora cf. gigantea A]|uniref:uncharacterized protein n=1 Tax=Porospora cf. gigantea A TaxID=2853593 RepID=UPI00355A0398|nr:MAG: hypothetical protein KVP18_000162 [Porospora cf. gigantea A]